MAYDPPTLGDLRPVVLRALRDPDGNVFQPEDVNDFINEGLMDLNGYRPRESVYIYVWDGTQTYPDKGPLTSVWSVEIAVAGEPQYMIPPVDRGFNTRNGWSFYATGVSLGAYWHDIVARLYDHGDQPEIVLYGYRDIDLPTSDAEVLDLASPADELGVRLYAKQQGLNRLVHDRSLYQQWLAATNNTDVSPTQLQGMLNQSEDEYTRHRRRSTLLRQVPVYDFMYVD